jgi:cytochrome c|tara:strand:- start:467 stop:604 length:138 start_codon:yes stop_codon:yes gene_type:complete
MDYPAFRPRLKMIITFDRIQGCLRSSGVISSERLLIFGRKGIFKG